VQVIKERKGKERGGYPGKQCEVRIMSGHSSELHVKLYGKGFYVCTETDWLNYASVVHTEYPEVP
jgi:hypothetical protein